MTDRFSIRTQLFVLGIALVAILFAGVQTAFAVGTNGSFELGTDPGVFSTEAAGSTDITDWAVGANGVDYIGTYWVAQDGVRSIDLNALDSGSVSQDLTTVNGAEYEVTFYISGNPAGGLALKEMTVSATGGPVTPYSYDTGVEGNSLGDMMWSQETYTFTATGVNTTLTFASTIAGAYGPALDNITITETLPDVTVTIVKYVEGVHATAGNADGLAFPMQSTWSDAGFPDGGGSYALSTVGFNNPNPYEATTSDMDSGANYATNEDTSGPNVGASCADGKPFALVGYTTGDTELDAAGGVPSPVSPSFTDLTEDQFVIVWNEECTTTITLVKDAQPDSAQDFTFTTTIPGNPLVTLDDDADGTLSNTAVFEVIPGVYSINENAVVGWTLSGTVCSDGSPVNAIDVSAGENITCTFTNAELPPPPPPTCTCCASSSSGNVSIINGIAISVNQSGCISNTTSSSASTGGNSAAGSTAGNGGRGGDVRARASGGGNANGNNGNVTTGAGGAGGAGGSGGVVITGAASSSASTFNRLNRVRIHINF